MSQPQTMNYVFDANQHEPSAGFSVVPADTYDLEVADTSIDDLKDDKGQTFVVKSKITTGQYAGQFLFKRYNLWNKMSAENARISHNELSALCHVTGIFKIDMSNGGKGLVGGRYKGRVTNDGQYNEIKEVFDANGNKPNKAGTGYAPAQTAPVASSTPGAAGGWGAPAAAGLVGAPAAPAAPAAFPPAGWQAHPTAAGYFYKDQEVLTEQQLREKMAASTAPAAPSAPPAVPTAPAAAPAQPAAWGQQAAPAGGVPAAPWGAPAA